ncbi:UBX domain (Ubx5) [Cordyceps militaris]|uniref:UBX domain (Ubx5) n=1 Tax=Cordyceps militaris TaxID=73501 RepID=A0A2H4SBD8_CORMI|nr:UBX domain (Ubx5) [Cordyceps militaris]
MQAGQKGAWRVAVAICPLWRRPCEKLTCPPGANGTTHPRLAAPTAASSLYNSHCLRGLDHTSHDERRPETISTSIYGSEKALYPLHPSRHRYLIGKGNPGSMDEENISSFAGITGSSTDVARGFLQIANDNLERAIALFFENPELVSGMSAGLSRTTTVTATAVPTTTSRARGGASRADPSDVIHIPSDDEEMDDSYADSGAEDTVNDDDDDDDSGHQAALLAANYAQEDEDAAMARRLQEELYQSGGGGEGHVRAPIARTTETLVAPGSAWGPDDDAAVLESLRRRRPGARGRVSGPTGPFSQRIWGDGTSSVGESSAGRAANGTHARRLEDLFRPPYELMARMSWDEARTLGKGDSKWILVNLQDMSDFNCQALNRDIWKDQSIKDLVSENFIFLQYDKDYPDAEEYLTFYFPNRTHENPDNYPHVSIIDPRTGEQVKVWSGRPFPGASEFHAELAEFLDRYSLAANSKNPVAKPSGPKPAVVDVGRMTEEEMLEMALKNSLSGPGAGGSGSSGGNSTSTPSIHDPDALTKDQGKAAEDSTADEPSSRAFAQISSTNPHAEPANDPATTTRIQFRHANGRVIRRFQVTDTVRTLFEWLKAEPFEGKEGVVFELKKMPQGQDLMETLEATIEEAGLKQGTVMIEFIED